MPDTAITVPWVDETPWEWVRPDYRDNGLPEIQMGVAPYVGGRR